MCDAAVVSGPHTRSGRVVFGKNSDRKQGECQPFLQFSAAHHPEGAELRCTHISIPQVRDTFRVMGHSPWWVWGFEHGVNECGVVVGNLAVFSREPPEETPGLIGMDLVRLALERADSARAAVDVIVELLAAHGQGGAALAPGGSGYHNSFLLADGQGAFILETTGRRYAVRSAQRDALSNHLCLHADWSEASPDLEAVARQSGWWSGAGKLDVAAAFRNEHVPGLISDPRHGRALELLVASEEHDVASMQRLLRDHRDGGLAPSVGATPEDEAYYTLCMHSEPVGTTTASLVTEIPAGPSLVWPAWISFGTPCTGIFLPTYITGVIPAALARGDDTPSEDSAWWIFERLQTAASRDFARHTPRLREAWSALERGIETARVAAEASARTAAQAGDLDECARQLTAFMDRSVADALSLAEELHREIG
jgi:dipeptidase